MTVTVMMMMAIGDDEGGDDDVVVDMMEIDDRCNGDVMLVVIGDGWW